MSMEVQRAPPHPLAGRMTSTVPESTRPPIGGCPMVHHEMHWHDTPTMAFESRGQATTSDPQTLATWPSLRPTGASHPKKRAPLTIEGLLPTTSPWPIRVAWSHPLRSSVTTTVRPKAPPKHGAPLPSTSPGTCRASLKTRWQPFSLSTAVLGPQQRHPKPSRRADQTPHACPLHRTTIVAERTELQPRFTTDGKRLTGEKNRVPLRPSKGAGVVKLVDTPDLGSGASAWGFESLHPHIFGETKSANRKPAHERCANLPRRPPD